jgi:signal peptidase II
MRRYLVFLIIPAIFLLDRWTKLLVVEYIPYRDGISVTPFFNIVHARNYGGAFSILAQFEAARHIFTVLPLLIAAVILYMLIRYRFSLSKNFSLTCIFAGALGNLYDRIRLGYVVDFLDVYYGTYHWPAFNVADTSISVGVGLWLLAELLEYRRTVTAGKSG